MDDELRAAMRRIDSRLMALEEAQKVNKDTFDEILSLFKNFKGFMAIMSVVESISVWVAKMSVAAGILWFLFKEAIVQAFKDGGK